MQPFRVSARLFFVNTAMYFEGFYWLVNGRVVDLLRGTTGDLRSNSLD